MKIIALVLALSSLSSLAATVHSAKLDALKKNILVDVSYGGGCKKHSFTLKMDACLETSPVSCTAKLVGKTIGGFDPCEAIISETVTVNLSEMGLDESYYANGSLTIVGDRNMRGQPSSATVILP